MDTKYKNKYIEYKKKYMILKKQLGGNKRIIGINYESCKIINHIKQYKQCIGYANIQIAMDAPFHGRVANEEIRSQGRSETFFPCYNEKYLILEIEKIFRYIKENYSDKKIVIQIARGRSAIPTWDEIIKPIIDEIGIIKYEYKTGYRSNDYYKPNDNEEFIFINYGMFAVLRGVEKIQVAEICNPVININVNKYINNKFIINNNVNIYEEDTKNILNNISFFEKIILIGIADEMEFITNKNYSEEAINELIDIIDKIII